MRTSLLAALLAISLTPVLIAEDWPKFLGPRGDSTVTEQIKTEWPADGLKQLWKVHVGAGYSTPVTTKDRVYILAIANDKEVLYALDATNGKEVWTSTVGSGWTKAGGMGYPGSRATPTIEGDTIYTFSGKGDLAARNLSDGRVKWHLNVLKDNAAVDLTWGCASSPAIIGDMVVVQTGANGPVAVAVDKKSGQYKWKASGEIAGVKLTPRDKPKAEPSIPADAAKAISGYATVLPIEVAGTRQLIVVAGNAVYALAPGTGKAMWCYPWSTAYDINAATPIYRDGKLLVTSGYAHGAIMLEVSADSAKKVWEKKTLQARFPTPIVDGEAVIGNSEGTLTAIDWATGETRWTAKDKIGMGSSMLRVGQHLVVLTERGKLSISKFAKDNITRLASFDAVEGQSVWSSPVISNGQLFVKGNDELVCYDVK